MYVDLLKNTQMQIREIGITDKLYQELENICSGKDELNKIIKNRTENEMANNVKIEKQENKLTQNNQKEVEKKKSQIIETEKEDLKSELLKNGSIKSKESENQNTKTQENNDKITKKFERKSTKSISNETQSIGLLQKELLKNIKTDLIEVKNVTPTEQSNIFRKSQLKKSNDDKQKIEDLLNHEVGNDDETKETEKTKKQNQNSKKSIDSCQEIISTKMPEFYKISSKKCINPFTDLPASHSEFDRISMKRKYPKHLPLKIIIFGPSFSYKEYVAKYLSEEYQLKLISVKDTLNELILLNQEKILMDPKAKQILEDLFEGHELSDDSKIYLIQRILLFSFDSFDDDESFALHMINQKLMNVKEQAIVYEKKKKEKKRRLSRFWKSKSISQEFLFNVSSFEKIVSCGFVLFDFPDNLKTAIDLEQLLTNFFPQDCRESNELQQITQILSDVYPELKQNLAEKVNEINNNSENKIDLNTIFKLKTEHISFFDAVLMIDCKTEDSYKRAFENYTDFESQNLINLKSQKHLAIDSLDYSKLKFKVDPCENAFTLCESLKHHEKEFTKLCDFYQHFRRTPSSEESILYKINDEDLTQCVENVCKVVDNILVHKKQHFNQILSVYFDKIKKENEEKEHIEKLRQEKFKKATILGSEIKLKLTEAVQNIKDSKLCMKKIVLSRTMIQLWAETAKNYQKQAKLHLYELDKIKRGLSSINGQVFDAFVESLKQTEDRDIHMNAFVYEYNEFSIKFQDLMFLSEVKAEFHFRFIN